MARAACGGGRDRGGLQGEPLAIGKLGSVYYFRVLNVNYTNLNLIELSISLYYDG